MPRRVVVTVAVATVFALMQSVLVAVSSPTRALAASTSTLYVNTKNFGPAGTCVPGNDAYDAVASRNACSLGAALTYANQHSTSGSTMTVTLATGFADSIPAGTVTLIPSTSQTASYMVPSGSISDFDGRGAYYAIDAPMVVDLRNKLGINRAGTTDSVSIVIRGQGITLRNASMILNAESSIVVAASASGFTLDGGSTFPSDNVTERFLEIHNGASGIVFKNYKIGNLNNDTDEGCYGAVCFSPKGQRYVPSRNVLIDNVDFSSRTTSTTCNGSNSTGCTSNGVVFQTNSAVNGLEIKNSRMSGVRDTLTDHHFLSTAANSGVSWSNLNVHDNTLTDNVGCTSNSTLCPLIRLPSNQPLGGVNHIRHNTFVNDPTLRQLTAIYWSGAGTGATASNLFIQDNHFDGFTGPAIRLASTGIVTVQRNTFGTRQASQLNTDNEEVTSSSSAGALLLNENNNANERIGPWYPTSTAVEAGCFVTVQAQAPGQRAPAKPLRLDVYHTGAATAELFLGSVTVNAGSATTATFTVSLRNAVDPDTGAVNGAVRIQTQSLGANPAQPESSQFSRVLPVNGSCKYHGITSITPQSGSVQGGTTVTLTGGGFTDYDGRFLLVNGMLTYSGGAAINTGIPLGLGTTIQTSHQLTTRAEPDYIFSASQYDPQGGLVSRFRFFINRDGRQVMWRNTGTSQGSVNGATTGTNGTVRTYFTTMPNSAGGQSTSYYTQGTTTSGTMMLNSTPNVQAPIVIAALQNADETYTVSGGNTNVVNGEFIIRKGATVLFDGRPAYDALDRTYGLYDLVSHTFFGNASATGKILGPRSPMQVTFSDPDGSASGVCSSMVVHSDTRATCVVPPSMLPGDRRGLADVNLVWGGFAAGTLDRAYEYLAPTLESISPEHGPAHGGGACAATGSGLVSILDALRFDGSSWIGLGVQQTGDVRVDVDFQFASASAPGALFLARSHASGNDAFGFEIVSNRFRSDYGPPTPEDSFAASNAARHQLSKDNSVTWLDGVVAISSDAPAPAQGYELALGAINTAGTVQGSYVGMVYSAQVYVDGELVRDLRPAAWTVAGMTVYGFLDVTDGSLHLNEGTGAFTGMRGGQPVAIPPTTLDFDGLASGGVTVTSPTTIACTAIPAHSAGRVSVAVASDGLVAIVPTGDHTFAHALVDSYLYWANGYIDVVKRGWLDADGLTYGEIMAEGNGGAVEVPSGSALLPGQVVTWTYTATFVHKDPVTGQPANTGEVGLSDVTIADDQLGEVCQLGDLPINTPLGCLASGQVG